MNKEKIIRNERKYLVLLLVMELVLISLYTYDIKPITNNGGIIKNTLAQYFEFVERTSKRKTAEKKKRKNIAQRKNNLPLGFF